MPYFHKLKPVGWYDSDADEFLCDDCFSKRSRGFPEIHEVADYFPVSKNDLKPDDLYTCDNCGKKFQRNAQC